MVKMKHNNDPIDPNSIYGIPLYHNETSQRDEDFLLDPTSSPYDDQQEQKQNKNRNPKSKTHYGMDHMTPNENILSSESPFPSHSPNYSPKKPPSQYTKDSSIQSDLSSLTSQDVLFDIDAQTEPPFPSNQKSEHSYDANQNSVLSPFEIFDKGSYQLDMGVLEQSSKNSDSYFPKTRMAKHSKSKIPPMPILSYNQPTPLTPKSVQYLNGFLRTQIGRTVRIQFLIGTNTLIEKSGGLIAVGSNYILLNETESHEILACDFSNIKFIHFENEFGSQTE